MNKPYGYDALNRAIKIFGAKKYLADEIGQHWSNIDYYLKNGCSEKVAVKIETATNGKIKASELNYNLRNYEKIAS